jgi:16S rRNA (adenine1518-N6/adenine1519-N6)-dimethyltransferase
VSARYGQHFLSNRHAAERIAREVGAGPEDDVLEIGPGKGALTPLLRTARRVVAVEVDDAMVQKLRNRWASTSPNLEIVHRDFLEFDLRGLASTAPFKVVGNLPYNLTSPILRKLSEWTNWSSAVVMVQKEVGDRLAARVGTPEYGALTVGMSLTCRMDRLFELSEKSFDPPPRVKSVVVRLTRRERPLFDDVDRAQRVIQAGFQQRRKTIENSFAHGLGMEKPLVRAALEQLAIDPGLRAERLSVEDFIRVTRKLLPAC